MLLRIYIYQKSIVFQIQHRFVYPLHRVLLTFVFLHHRKYMYGWLCMFFEPTYPPITEYNLLKLSALHTEQLIDLLFVFH